MKLSHLYKLLTGKIKVNIKPRITFKNLKAVVQSFYRKNSFLPIHIYEQIIWRRTEIIKKQPTCWESGYCKVCGCDIIGKSMEDRECSAAEINEEPCYPFMMEKDEWNDYKLKNNIKLFLDVNC